MGSFDGKTALVTAAASGIGEATAKRLAAAGARVVIADIDDEGAERVASEAGANAIAIHCDVTDPSQVERAVNTTLEKCEGLDVLVNNAGMGSHGSIFDQSDDEFREIVAMNLHSTFYGIRFGGRAMTEQGGGAIVNTASTAGYTGVPMYAAYCASKAGVINLTRTAALELRDKGIRVNCVCPGFVLTPMAERAMGTVEQVADSAVNEMVVSKQGRWGHPDDLAKVIVHLASPDSGFVTGIFYPVDNGLTASMV